jgi:hypothetical protein
MKEGCYLDLVQTTSFFFESVFGTFESLSNTIN